VLVNAGSIIVRILHQHVLARLVEPENYFIMDAKKPGDIDPDNIINITMEDLNDTQKQLLQRKP
jgi:hypothetical protein